MPNRWFLGVLEGWRSVFADMDEWKKVRYPVLREGKSKREAQRETGMHWKTQKKLSSRWRNPNFIWPEPSQKM